MKRLFAVTAALWLSGCATVPTPNAGPQYWLTTPDQAHKLERQPDLVAQAGDGTATVHVDPARQYQTIQGFGAAITDASAELIDGLPPAQRDALLKELFGRNDGGLGLSFTRLTVGASDFSRTHYSYDDSPGNAPDPQLRYFSIAPARAHVLPVTRAALAINPDLAVMISPWSAPAWMKTTRSLIKGRLEPSAYPAFADYLARTISEFGRDGVPVRLLSIQNEPDFEPDSYPGMRMSAAERAAVIGGHLGPLLARRGIRTQILDWDHNWDHPEQPLGVLGDPVARRYVAGIAWHCYAGDVDAQFKVHDAYPDKDVWFTECSGGNWSPKFDEVLGWMTSNLIIASSNSGSKGTSLWNLALDPDHGPHDGGCGDCRGVVTVDPKSGAITRNVEYYVLGHASRFALPGARRIAVTAGGGIEATGFVNRDRSIAVILYRPASASSAPTVYLAGRRYAVSLPPGAAATLFWPARR